MKIELIKTSRFILWGFTKEDALRHEYMTLLMRDQENVEKGREQGIFGMVSALRDLDIPDSTILQKIQEKFLLTKEESQKYLSR